MAVFSPNPNIVVNPLIQKSQMLPWDGTTQYNYGDCVIGSDGMAYALLAPTDAGNYPLVGLTNNPIFTESSFRLNSTTGLARGGDFLENYITGAILPPRGGAVWINLSLLSPVIRPWSRDEIYREGDLVYYPTDQPSVVWRYSTNLVLVPAEEPNVPGLNQIANSFNKVWTLISNPLQYGSFNPTLPSQIGTNFNSPTAQPLPSIRPNPI